MNTSFKFASLFLIVGLVIFSSCKKEEPSPKVDDKKPLYDNSTAPISNAIIESAFDEMTNMSDQAINGDLVFYNSPTVSVFYTQKGQKNVADKVECNVIITIDTISTTRSIEIDWGTTNCDCNDGKQRRGKIITTFTGRYRDAGTVITHTPVDYYVNNNHIEGSKTVINAGYNTENQAFFYITVNGAVTMANGEYFTYYSERIRTWVAGYNTPLVFIDDEYEITGNTVATSSNGNGYEATVTEPLRVQVGCAFVKSGVLEFKPTNKPLRIINYGDGACDATFTVTINGVTYTIN
jgi:hypothetical protein